MGERLRVGIVGLGYGQRVLLPAFRKHGRCEVIGVCGRRAQPAREVAQSLGLRAYDDWRTLVDDPAVDTVVIATPPDSHGAIATAAFARGKHVFCEKPLAASFAMARQMAEAAAAAAVAHMVGFEVPETPEWDEARGLLAAGYVGRLRHVSVTWHLQTFANRLKTDSWKLSAAEAGGALNEFVSHCFHYLEWLLGPVAEVWAAPIPEVERVANRDPSAILTLRLGSGATVSISVCTDAIGGDGHAIRIYGETGMLALVNPVASHACGFMLQAGDHDGVRTIRERPAIEPGVDGRIAAVGRLVDRFAAWALDRRPGRPSFEDGLRVQRLLDAAWSSRQESRWCPVG